MFTKGVSQSSVLGPELFTLFVIDREQFFQNPCFIYAKLMLQFNFQRMAKDH